MSFPSEEQRQVIQNCVEALKNKKDAALCGPAGSGKSSVVSVIIDDLEKLKIPIALTALTNQAANSLTTAIFDASKKVVGTSTIHSFLALKPTPNGLVRRKGSDYPYYDFSGVVVVDECSMMDSEKETSLWFWIQESKKDNPNFTYLFVGDKYQLPPINEDLSIVFSDQVGFPLFELTKVYRQKDGNPISWVANKFRLAQDGKILD